MHMHIYIDIFMCICKYTIYIYVYINNAYIYRNNFIHIVYKYTTYVCHTGYFSLSFYNLYSLNSRKFGVFQFSPPPLLSPSLSTNLNVFKLEVTYPRRY